MAGLLRYQFFLSICIIFLGIWKASLARLNSIQSLLEQIPLSSLGFPIKLSVPRPVTAAVIVWLPLWALLLLGIYALLSVIYRVATFGDYPDAAVELSAQIEEAKMKLKERGFDF